MPKQERNGSKQDEVLSALLQARAFDYYRNPAARAGWNTPSLTEATQYEMVRFSYNYWALITLYRNHWISGQIVDVPACDMVKAWPRLTSDIPPKDLTRIDRAIRRTQTKQKLLDALKWGRLFGGAGALIVIDGHQDHLEEPLDLKEVELGAYRGVIPFDRWVGIINSSEISVDMDRPIGFNLPKHYTVQSPDGGKSFKVHSSRILRFTGPTVPAPEYQAQQYWGISVLERAYEEIRKRDNMSWNILNLTYRAQLIGMVFPELAQTLSGVGMSQTALQQWYARMQAVNEFMNNQSLLALPKDGSMSATNYTFSGVADVYQQFQLDIAGAAQIPVTRLFGRTISGLGQSNDADERIYEERIAMEQDTVLRPLLETLYRVICMSELGEDPEDLDLLFPSVRVLDEKEKSDLAKTTGDNVNALFGSGIFTRPQALKELKQSSDVTGFATNITDEDIEEAQKDEDLGLNANPGEIGAEGVGEAQPKGENPTARAQTPGKGIWEKADGAEREDLSRTERLHNALDLALDKRYGRAADGRGRRDRLHDVLDYALDDWSESDHPRVKGGEHGGEFTSGSGGGSATKSSGLQSAPENREQWPDHIKKLKLPPAWKDVRISGNPDADLMAIGKDAKGRPQYVYSDRFRNTQAEAKFARIKELDGKFERVLNQNAQNIKSSNPRIAENAACAALVMDMGIRPGSDTDTKAKVKAYGATTLRGDHVAVEDGKVFLRFTGKKGVALNLPVENSVLAKELVDRAKTAGADGKLFPDVTDKSLLDYVHTLDGGKFKTKDFRTLLGTREAMREVGQSQLPKDEKDYKRKVKDVATKVSRRLGNTPTVALQSYINPVVFAPWRNAIAA